MSPELRRRQRGLGIIAAIVILVIFAVLGSFIAMLSTSQHRGAALDVDGARAYAAALSGSEWGVARMIGGNCAPLTTLPQAINGMTVTVTCGSATGATTGHNVEAGFGAMSLIVSTACNLPLGGNCPGDNSRPDYVERQIVALPEAPAL